MSNFVLIVPVILGTALAISVVALCFCFITIRRLKKRTKDVNYTTSATISSDSKYIGNLQFTQQPSKLVEKDCCLPYQNVVHSLKVQQPSVPKTVPHPEPYLSSFYETPVACSEGFKQESSYEELVTRLSFSTSPSSSESGSSGDGYHYADILVNPLSKNKYINAVENVTSSSLYNTYAEPFHPSSCFKHYPHYANYGVFQAEPHQLSQYIEDEQRRDQCFGGQFQVDSRKQPLTEYLNMSDPRCRPQADYLTLVVPLATYGVPNRVLISEL